jgi:mevalonate kinase
LKGRVYNINLKMVTCSAPGKVYLFGEHAVVYGEPAIACAINMRISTSVKLVSSGKIKIDAMGKRLNCMSDEFKYACCAAQTIKQLFNTDFGAEITIKSQLPPRQGLGSSAAVTVSTIKALAECLGIELKNEAVAKIGHQVETAVQGMASPADTFVSSTGGVVLIEQTKTCHLSSLNIPIIIGATGIERSTSDVIASVTRLKQKYPTLITDVLSSIGDITRLGKQKLAEEDFVGLGELMNINQGLLESIGVSDEALSRLIYASRAAGALGAKITGAGRGGCMLAITQDENVKNVSQAIEKNDAKVLNTAFSDSGLQTE